MKSSRIPTEEVKICCDKKIRGSRVILNFNLWKHDNCKDILMGNIKLNDSCDLEYCFKYMDNNVVRISLRVKTNEAQESRKIRISSHSLKYNREFSLDTINCAWHFIKDVMSTLNYRNQSVHKFDLNVIIFKVNFGLNSTKLYEDTELTDFELCAEDGSVRVHRACLAVQSPVLRAMMAGEWKETAEGRVQLRGVTIETLQHLKNFIYLGKLPESDLSTLLQLAHFYMIEDLTEACVDKMTESLTHSKMISLLELAIKHDIPQLTAAVTAAVTDDVATEIWLKTQKQSENPAENVPQSQPQP